jgi:predicted amidohydrolase YtcJ
MVTTSAFMRSVCEKALNSGFQVNTHAIGDSAVRMVLQEYAGFLKGKNDLRWRIEHAQVIHKDDFELFGKYSIIPSIQATHATSDMSWAGHRLGTSRLHSAYAYKRLLEQNGWIPNGTDFPVEEIYPLNTFYAATIRKNKEGKPVKGFMPENALSREQALKSITIWAAKAFFEDLSRGSLEEGKMADLVILDQDLINIPEDQILQAKILYTILGGEIVYSRTK